MEIERIHKIYNDQKLKEWFKNNKLCNNIDNNNLDFILNDENVENKEQKYQFSYNVILSYENIIKRYFISDEIYKNTYGKYALGYKGAKESDRIYNLKSLCDYIT